MGRVFPRFSTSSTVAVGTGCLIFAVVAACTGSDKTATPSPIEEGLFGPSEVAPAPTVPPTLPSVPNDWQTYAWEASGYSFRYPSGWYITDGSVHSTDPSTWVANRPPEGTLSVQFSNLTSEEVPRPAQAADFTLNGVRGWQIVEVYDPSRSGGRARVHTVAFENSGRTVHFVGYFTNLTTVETFWQIVSSLTLPT
jgi:hypothetical protein